MVRFLYLVPLFAAGLQALASPVLREVSTATGALTVDQAYDAVTKLQSETHAVYSDIYAARAHEGATDAKGRTFADRLQHSYDEAKRVLQGAKATSLVPSKGHNVKDVDKVSHVIINESRAMRQDLTVRRQESTPRRAVAAANGWVDEVLKVVTTLEPLIVPLISCDASGVGLLHVSFDGSNSVHTH